LLYEKNKLKAFFKKKKRKKEEETPLWAGG
jgi:hypothetical protein